MGAQLPSGSVGPAAFAFAYSCISLISSGLLCWLTVVHREGWSYVFLLCVSTGVSTVMSLTQQARTIIFYQDIMWDQFNNRSGTNPELAIANGSRGIDLALYYMQYWSYNVQALLVMFWAGELAQSVYGLNNRPKTRRVLKKVNITGKAVSFLFPALTILLLRVPSIQANFLGFIMLADLPLMISLAIGSLLMMAILVRYVKTKKGFTHWAPPSYQTSSSGGGGTTSSAAAQTEFSSTQYSSAAGAVRKPKSARKQGMHDRWLMVRFTVSFLILAVFEVTNILFQMQSIHNLQKDSLLTQPDLSTERANSTFFLFLPGTTAGIFLMFVFGTTSGCRTKIRETFTPKSWQARRERLKAEKEGFAMSGRDLELNQAGVTEEYDLGSPSSKGGRIVRSSSVTVTYQNKATAGGASVALESLPPHARRSQYGRKMSFKSADDLLLESDGELNGDSDRDSTSDIMPANTQNNSDNNNNINKTTLSYRESLNKSLPNPNDPPIARIAHFQSITRPQNIHSRPQRSATGASIPEHQDEPSLNHNEGGVGGSSSARTAMMNRQFAEHQRRQTPSQSQQQAAQRTQALKRQWTHGNSSRAAPQGAGTNSALSPGEQLGEEYYGSSPEHSDDSGPVLPIMAAKRT